MSSVINSKSTKAQLLEHIAELDAALLSARRQVGHLCDQLSMARSAPALPQGRATHADYLGYVSQQQRAARTAGRKGVAYLSYSAWARNASALC